MIDGIEVLKEIAIRLANLEKLSKHADDPGVWTRANAKIEALESLRDWLQQKEDEAIEEMARDYEQKQHQNKEDEACPDSLP